MDYNFLTPGTNMTFAAWEKQRLSYNLYVDDGFGKPGSLSIQKKSENESKFLFVQDFCMHAALSHYVLHVAFMIVQFEYAKLQVVITVIACMEIPEGQGADEIISKRDIEEEDLLDVQVLCPFTAYNYDRTYFDVSDIAQLSNMDGGLQDDLANDDNFFRDARDIDGTIWMSLNKANAAIPIYTLSLSARKNDLSLFTLSPITFIEVSGSEVSGSEVSGCNSFQALIDSSALGIVWRKMKKLCSQEVYKEPVDTNKSDHEDRSDEEVRKGFINKTAYQSNDIHRPACNLGATSLFIKNLIIALMCFAMVNPAAGGPVLDKMKMVDKLEAVYRKFPLLKSNWCQNPEQPTDTCPNRDFVMKLKVQTCQYKCPAGEKVLCLESEFGMVFFCIQEDLRCDEGIGWQVEDIEHRGSDKVVMIKESPCPDGFYQSLPSKCYDACKDEHEPLHLIPGPFMIVSEGNNIHPTMLRCKHEDGFYNPKNQSYIRFNQDDFRMDFCTNVRDLNPCKSGQMPLYNGTCVNHCSHGYVRDDTDFFCKINGTLEHAGNNLSEAGPKNEIEVGKEEGKDGDRDVQRNKEGNRSEHLYQIPWYLYLVLGVIGIAILLISIKLFCFPNRSDDDDDMSDSTERTNESKVDDDETFPKEAIDSQTVVKKEIGPVIASSSNDDDDMSDSTSDEERTNESKVDDDETFPKEAIDSQTVVKKEIGPVKTSSSKSSGFKVKKKNKYNKNLFFTIDKVETINFGSVTSKEDRSALVKSLCDEQQIPEESVKMDFLKMVSEKALEMPSRSRQDLSETESQNNNYESERNKDTFDGTREKETELDHELTKPLLQRQPNTDQDCLEACASPSNSLKTCIQGGELKKEVDDTFTQSAMANLIISLMSCGALINDGNLKGTVFRVGSKYVMTAYHVIKDIKHLIEAACENIFVNFEESVCNVSCETYRVNIEFYSEEADIAILALHVANLEKLPKPLLLWPKNVDFLKIRNISVIGYGHADSPYKKHLEKCQILTDPLTEERVTAAKDFLQKKKDELIQDIISNRKDHTSVEREYAEYNNSNIIKFDCYMAKGLSGGPILTNEHETPRVIGMVIGMRPELFYNLSPNKQTSFPKEFMFEFGVKMQIVYKQLNSVNRALAQDIFPPDTTSSNEQLYP